MAMLVDGKWDEHADHTTIADGRYERRESLFRDWITADGSSGFAAEPGRYHLYIAHWCPWAYRTAIFRTLKGLEDVVGISVASSSRKEQGWMFVNEHDQSTDAVYGKRYLHELYTLADSGYTGRPTVPTLWDRERQTVVSNESSDIIRMLNDAFDELVPGTPDYYPAELRAEIDAVNAVVYERVNNGVYRAGFATSQEAYDEAIQALFGTLDELEHRLDASRYLCGGQITEADWRLFSTLIRFDQAYYQIFKCSQKHIYEYPNLWNYTLELYQHPGIAEVTHFEDIRIGYFATMPDLNPSGIVPPGPDLDYLAAHDRERLPATFVGRT